MRALAALAFLMLVLTGSARAVSRDTIDVRRAAATDTVDAERAAAGDSLRAAPGGPDDDLYVSLEYADLQARRLLLPVEGVRPEDLRDGFESHRGRRVHHAIDIMAPRYTPIHAVEDGVIVRMDAHGGAGGITIYQFDPTETYGYYYAHLERYADDLAEGDHVARGQVLGYVGSSGNAPERSPHLHFAIHRLAPGHKPWVGAALNPYLVFLP